MPLSALSHQIASPRAGEEPHPCLLLLHGRGSNEEDLLGLAEFLDPRFLCVGARAPLPTPGLPGYQWHTSLSTGRPEPVSLLQSVARLRRFLGELPQSLPIDPARLFVLGFSQGAAMALALAAAEPAAVAGTLALSGFWPPVARPEALRGKAVFVAHGTADPILPLAFGHAVRDALRGAGADLEYREYPLGHQIDEAELADLDAWLLTRAWPDPGRGEAAPRPARP